MAKQKKSKMALYTRQDKIILYCGYALLGVFLLAIIIPMIYIVIASFMDPVTLYKDVLQLYLYCNKERELPEQSGDWRHICTCLLYTS